MKAKIRRTGEPLNEFDLAAALGVFQQGRFAIMVCVAIAVALALAYIIDATSLYSASASILVDPYRAQSTLVPEPVSDAPVDEAVVDTQVELIKSEAVARIAIARLGKSADKLIVGEKQSKLKAFMIAASDWIKTHLSSGDLGEPDHTLELILALEESLFVKRTGLTFVIQVTYQGQTPSGAATVANVISEAYLDDQINAKIAAAQRVSALLSDRARELRRLAEEADRKVQAYQGNDRIALQQLNSAADTARTTYETFQRRAMETEQAGDNSASVARLVSPASPPERRSWPRSTIILGAAIVIGVGLGFCISLVRQRFGRFYRDGDDVAADFGGFIGRLRLENRRRLARNLRRGTLVSADVLATLRDANSNFADVARRVAVRFDPLAASADRICIGVLSFGIDISGGVLAFRLAAAAVEANKSAMLVEAQPVSRLLGEAWRLNGEESEISLGSESIGFDQSNVGKLFGLSLRPRDAIDVTPAKVRELMGVVGRGQQVVVVSFSDHDFGSMGAWISGLDAFVIVVQRKRTRRRDARQLMSVAELQEKCVGVVLS